MRYGVHITFEEYDAIVYDILGPFDRYLADLVAVDMAGGIMRGPRWVHVLSARIVPWVEAA